MAWNLDADQPLYIQIVNKLKVDIVAGAYKAGDKLESVRDLAKIAAVNPNTMQKALQELEKTNLIKTQRTSGRYITEDESLLEALKNEILIEKLEEFMESARALGYTEDEIEGVIANYLKKGGK